MKIIKIIKAGIVFFILLELVISFSSIWLLTRENYYIAEKYNKSVDVLSSCNELAKIMSLHNFNLAHDEDFDDFFIALNTLGDSLTSQKEKKLFNVIIRNYKKIFKSDDILPRNQVISAIGKISRINVNRLDRYKKHVRKYHISGAWAIVFLQSFIFFVQMILIIRLKHRALKPLEEIYDVVTKQKDDDKLRRCYTQDAHRDIKVIGDGINKLLDEKIKYGKY